MIKYYCDWCGNVMGYSLGGDICSCGNAKTHEEIPVFIEEIKK